MLEKHWCEPQTMEEAREYGKRFKAAARKAGFKNLKLYIYERPFPCFELAGETVVFTYGGQIGAICVDQITDDSPLTIDVRHTDFMSFKSAARAVLREYKRELKEIESQYKKVERDLKRSDK